ncbi:MFS transporter [Acinetobacter nectaris]|uniref:MFS transporter n=1 Tax=Acinetobacter nectaris TaxID=1219382 RepID=UPI001F2065EA|nr:MFS transporter [Acinetobacter nectaris]MCF9046884.1 MFS transporter [Acinetobacter nectaris]
MPSSKTLNTKFLYKTHIQRRATRLSFFNLGFAMASWAPLIPFVKQRLGLDHEDLGMLILCIGIGSMLAMPLAGMLIQRVGCRFIISIASIIFVLALPLIGGLNNTIAMAAVLTVFGMASGATGVAINLQAVLVEKKSVKPLMSNFHGMCSLGGLVSALTMTGLLSIHLSALHSAYVLSALVAIIALCSAPAGLTQVADSNTQTDEAIAPKKKKVGFPHPIILVLGMMCFITFLTEGAALDWSGVYLTTNYQVPLSIAGLAYGFFATTMTLGRFSGHYMMRVLGEKNLILFSSICAALGMAIVVVAPVWHLVLLGYALVGLGSSNVVPVLFSRVGRQNFTPKAQALSYVSSIAYSGVLCGPALIGFVGQHVGLTTVFTGIAVCLLLIAICNKFTMVGEGASH